MEEEANHIALPAFANEPENLHVEPPTRIANSQFMTLGNDISLGPGCMLNAIRRYPGRFLSGVPDDVDTQYFEPEIRIGNRVSATGYLTVSAVSSVIIEDDVLIASHVFIGDHSHGHSRADIAYKYQRLEGISPVAVGRGSWIGEHVTIMPGVTIGEYSIIGANSVVTRDVPPKSVVIGAPARVVRKWSGDSEQWVAVSRDT